MRCLLRLIALSAIINNYPVRLLTGLIAQQIGITARWYSNKTPLLYFYYFTSILLIAHCLVHRSCHTTEMEKQKTFLSLKWTRQKYHNIISPSFRNFLARLHKADLHSNKNLLKMYSYRVFQKNAS